MPAAATLDRFPPGGSGVKAAEAAAALMRNEGKLPEDRILVVDRDLLVYVASGAEPPLQVFHPLHFLCYLPMPETLSALAKPIESKPAFVVIANPPCPCLRGNQPARGRQDPPLPGLLRAWALRKLRYRLAWDFCRLWA
jgi:hypothetical protein